VLRQSKLAYPGSSLRILETISECIGTGRFSSIQTTTMLEAVCGVCNCQERECSYNIICHRHNKKVMLNKRMYNLKLETVHSTSENEFTSENAGK